MQGWIKYGYRLPVSKKVEPFNLHRALQPQELPHLEREISRLLAQGTVVEIPARQAKWVSHCRLEPKKEPGKFRLIIDLRHLNEHLHSKPFKYEAAEELIGLIRNGDYLTSTDLKDGYHHLGIHPSHQHLVQVQVGHKFYQFTELMFGLKTACHAFTKLIRPLVRHFRSAGNRIHVYLDDFCLISPDIQCATQARDRFHSLLERVGLSRNVDKGQFTPSQVITHLGIQFDSVQQRCQVPPEKQRTVSMLLKSAVKYCTEHRRWIQVRRLAAVAGSISALRLALPTARAWLDPLYAAIRTRTSWAGDVRLTNSQLRQLELLANLDLSSTFGPWEQQTPLFEAATDASNTGWAAVTAVREQLGFFGPENLNWHINLKEMYAILQLFVAHAALWRNSTVLLHTDSMVCMYVIRKGASRSAELNNLFRELWNVLFRFNITVVVEHIASKDNTRADFLSRLVPHHEWHLTDQVWQWIMKTYPELNAERFASADCHRLQVFNSLALVNGSGGDAFAVRWSNSCNWLNPPFALIPQVIKKLRQEAASAVLLVPFWPSASWWPDLLQIAQVQFMIPPKTMRSSMIAAGQAVPEPLRHRWTMCIACTEERRMY